MILKYSLLCSLFILLLCSACSKKRTYRCKKGCVTIQLEGNLVDLNQATAPKNTPYKILFMPTATSWIDFEPDNEYLVKEGVTGANGIMKETIKVGEAELNGDHSVYIRYYPSASYHFCDNPAFHVIDKVPVDFFDKHILTIYERKTIQLQMQRTDTATYNQTELLIGAATDCTTGFFSDPPLTINAGLPSANYPVYMLMNKMNILTVKKTKTGTPNTYTWVTDSVYVDTNVSQYTLSY